MILQETSILLLTAGTTDKHQQYTGSEAWSEVRGQSALTLILARSILLFLM